MANTAQQTPAPDLPPVIPFRPRAATCRAPYRAASLSIREALALSPANARLWILDLDLTDFGLFARQVLAWADRGRA